MPESEALYDRLRRLAVEDPKEAKRVFLAAFESNSQELYEFLGKLQRPNEGRLRQVVANAIRTVSAGAILDHVTPLPRRDAAEENQTAGF